MIAKNWEVTISVNCEDVLIIGSQHLAGVENIDDYADTVRHIAEHLLSFIGPQQADTPDVKYSVRVCKKCKDSITVWWSKKYCFCCNATLHR